MTRKKWESYSWTSSLHDEKEQKWARKTFENSNKIQRREEIVLACHQGARGVTYRDTNDQGVSVYDGPVFYGNRPMTLMEYNKTGGVCGSQAFYTVGVCQSHGIPAFPVALPGHCAYMTQPSPGKWELCQQDNPRRTTIHAKYPEIQGWGRHCFLVFLYQRCITQDLDAYTASEVLCAKATAISSTPEFESDQAAALHSIADLLSQATDTCPMNYRAWKRRFDHIKIMALAGVVPDQSTWVNKAFSRFKKVPREDTVLSQGKSVSSCKCEDPECGKTCTNLVDLIDTEWWTTAESAWVQIDLGEKCFIKQLKIRWWAWSVSESYKVLSSVDGQKFQERCTHKNATKSPKGPFDKQPGGGVPNGECNGLSELPGWKDATRYVRLELSKGHIDPWGNNRPLGMRNFDIIGLSAEIPAALQCNALDMLDAAVRTTFPITGLSGTHEKDESLLQLAREDLVSDVKALKEELSKSK
mmetsp:Transcript_37473/g.73723  ORF Transcript_37473/g.73723 Transcript_37473/m.73723 type:complete len:471 (+) Transcript_37473:512-1924(+)